MSEDIRVYTLLGVFLTLRHMIPHLTNQNHQELSLKGSFGVMTQEQEVKVNAQQIIQVCRIMFQFVFSNNYLSFSAFMLHVKYIPLVTTMQLTEIIIWKENYNKKT